MRFYIPVAALCLLTAAQAQTEWAKHDSNPVFVKWGLMETYAIGQPTNLYENDTFKMWYTACAVDHRGRVFRANSLDGIHWTRANLGLPVLDIGSPGSWDQKWLDTPEVLHDQTGYRMLYYGDTTDQPAPIGGLGSALGLATSADGLAWTKDSVNPVFRKDTALSWQNLWVESPALLFVNDTLRMWYSAVAYEPGRLLVRIGYAWSLDGRDWTRLPTPAIDLGLPGAFDDMWAAVPAVIRRDSLYEMWYSAVSFADQAANDTIDTLRIGYATSTDGVNWSKYSEPVFSTFSPPYRPEADSGGPWAPDVVFDGSRYRMWYETKFGFGYAVTSSTATEEPRVSGPVLAPPDATIVRGVLFLEGDCPRTGTVPKAALLDISGRKVLVLCPGANDVSRLSPGVYFIQCGRPRSESFERVVLTR